MLFLSSAAASSLQTSTYCIKCVHTQLLNPTQHTKYYPLPSDLETSNSIFLGISWGKICMYYPRRWELAWRFHVLMDSFQLTSVPQRQLSASARHSAAFLGLEVDGMDQAAAYCTGRSTQDGKCVRARTQYVPQTIVPSRSHRYDVPEVEFKKNSILATLADFCLSGLRWVFAGFCKFQVVLDASPRCHSAP